MTAAVTVERSALSSFCRDGRHKFCAEVDARCHCDCHPPGRVNGFPQKGAAEARSVQPEGCPPCTSPARRERTRPVDPGASGRSSVDRPDLGATADLRISQGNPPDAGPTRLGRLPRRSDLSPATRKGQGSHGALAHPTVRRPLEAVTPPSRTRGVSRTTSGRRLEPGDGDPRHGTANGYSNLKCRCKECRAAWATYGREKGYSVAWRRRQGMRPAAEVRAEVAAAAQPCGTLTAGSWARGHHSRTAAA